MCVSLKTEPWMMTAVLFEAQQDASWSPMRSSRGERGRGGPRAWAQVWNVLCQSLTNPTIKHQHHRQNNLNWSCTSYFTQGGPGIMEFLCCICIFRRPRCLPMFCTAVLIFLMCLPNTQGVEEQWAVHIRYFLTAKCRHLLPVHELCTLSGKLGIIADARWNVFCVHCWDVSHPCLRRGWSWSLWEEPRSQKQWSVCTLSVWWYFSIYIYMYIYIYISFVCEGKIAFEWVSMSPGHQANAEEISDACMTINSTVHHWVRKCHEGVASLVPVLRSRNSMTTFCRTLRCKTKKQKLFRVWIWFATTDYTLWHIMTLWMHCHCGIAIVEPRHLHTISTHSICPDPVVVQDRQQARS